MIKRTFTFLLGFLCLSQFAFSQNSCSNPEVITSGQFYTYNLPTGSGNAPGGPNYGCLTNTLNPYYYTLTVCTAGDIVIDMQPAGSGADINYVCWGPVVGATSLADLCNSVITGAPVASCSESASLTETMTITNAQPGEAYLIMMTNINDATDQVYVWENFNTVGTYCDSMANAGCSGAMLDICEVTMNDSATHCKVMWEKIPGLAVDYYNIYRLSPSNTYDLIDIVFDNDSSYYIDISSNPNQQSYRYKIDYLDTCGNISWQSDYHQTIHLQATPGFGSVNLSWNSYYGFIFNTYYVMRGTDPFNMTIIDSIASVFNSYTDLSPVASEPCYQISVVNPTPCQVTRSMEQTALSNVFIQYPVGVEEISLNDFKVYPNPVTDRINIETSATISECEIHLFDASGRLILSDKMISNKQSFDLSGLSAGVYMMDFIHKGQIVHKPIILAR